MRLLNTSLWLGSIEQLGELRGKLFVVLTVAVTVGAWWGLSALASPFLAVAHPDKSHEITVGSHTGRIQHPIRKRYAAQIATLPGARDLYYTDLAVITCGGSGFSVTLNAFGGPGVPDILRQEGYSLAQIHAFQQDPLAILTDSKTAQRCGWRTGKGVTPMTMFGRPLEIHVGGIIDQTESPGSAVAHYSYVNRVGAGVAKPDMVAKIYVRARNPRDNGALAAQIEAMFAHDDPPVEATPDTVNQSALARFGEVQYLLAFVMAAVFLCCALVLTSVIAHTAAQRRPHMALLQVLGFPRVVIWAALIWEVMAIIVLGAAIGLGAGYLAVYWLQRTLGSTFQSIAAPTWTWMWLGPGLALLLVASLLVPTLIVARMQPTDCRDT